MNEIHERISKAMADIGAIPKSERNRQQNYRFRSIDAVLQSFQPVLVKHGLLLSIDCTDHRVETRQEAKPQGRGERSICHATLSMRVTIHASDGSSISHTACGEGIDYGGDKATNKAMAAAFKYAMLLGFCVPVEAGEIEDSDRQSSATTESAKPEGKPGPSTVANDSKVQPDQVEEIKRICRDLGLSKEKLIEILSQKNIASPADLTVEQADKLIAMLKSKQTETQAEETFG